MNITGFPNCCTAQVIFNLGSNMVPNMFSKDEIRTYIQGQLPLQKRYGYAVSVVMTMSQQTNANEVLEELGFKHSKWMTKTNHKNTQLRLWWYPLDEFKEEVLEEPKPKIPPAAQPLDWGGGVT